jgi:hypothetical protein
MANRDYSRIVAENNDSNAIELTVEDLKKKGQTMQGFGLKPGQAVYIPTIEEKRRTLSRPIRQGGEPNVPVVVAIKVTKDENTGKYVIPANPVATEVGISSLFNTDFDGKAHPEDTTSAMVVDYSNHFERLDAFGGRVIEAGREVTILIPRTERIDRGNGKISVQRLYSPEGKVLVREKKIVVSHPIDESLVVFESDLVDDTDATAETTAPVVDNPAADTDDE